LDCTLYIWAVKALLGGPNFTLAGKRKRCTSAWWPPYGDGERFYGEAIISDEIKVGN